MPTEFVGKTWIYAAASIIFGGLTLFGLTLGPLFLFGFMKNAKGKPVRGAGFALTAISLLFLLIFALALFNFLARRRPLLRLYREGIEIVQIGTSSLGRIPFIPARSRAH